MTAPVGADGQVTLFNSSAGSAHLIADVAGYYLEGEAALPGVATVPTRIPGFTEATSVVAGESSGYAPAADGTVHAWGRNQNGQLGNGTTTASTIAVKVPGLAGVRSIVAGGFE